MNDYLTEGWPLGPTSTVYMSGKAVFNIRRYGKPGIITTVEMFPADAQSVRDAVQEAIREARAEAWDEGNSGYRLGGTNNPYRAAATTQGG